MKAKLFAALVFFFALSLAGWSYAPGEAEVADEDVTPAEWPEFPNCSGRDTGTSPLSHSAATGKTLTQRENPVESAFVELGCLLASN
ncbi:MAG: hypothetical protein P8Y54_13165 [Xanthomonadales bacterium]